MNDGLKLKGHVIVEKVRNGEVVERKEFDNLIVNVGKAEVAGLIGGVSGSTAFGYIAVGTGTTAESATDTALVNEVDRQASTNSLVTTSVTNDTLQMQATFNFTASYNITEYGIFNAATGGDMLSRKTDTGTAVNNGDSLQVTWKIQVQ